MKLADNKATLSFSNGSPSIDLPVYQGNIGPDVIDIRKLYGQSGMFTYDPGFLSTASCQSSITFIDGDKGELLYRGYPIEQLATELGMPSSQIEPLLQSACAMDLLQADAQARYTYAHPLFWAPFTMVGN